MNEIDRDKLVRGSIRVFKDPIFYENKELQHMSLSYRNLKAILKVTTLPKEVKEIFLQAGIVVAPDTHNGLRLMGTLKGLDFDDIVSADEEHLRVRFSGLTETDLKQKLQAAEIWFDLHEIEHGEKDGKAACIFKCLTSEQLELGEF